MSRNHNERFNFDVSLWATKCRNNHYNIIRGGLEKSNLIQTVFEIIKILNKARTIGFNIKQMENFLLLGEAVIPAFKGVFSKWEIFLCKFHFQKNVHLMPSQHSNLANWSFSSVVVIKLEPF